MAMRPQDLSLVMLTAGLLAAIALARRASPQADETAAPISTGIDLTPHRFVLAGDAPSLGLHRGEALRVDPSAPIRIGDVVALKSATGELVLTRFHDELMHCVSGLVVREVASLRAA